MPADNPESIAPGGSIAFPSNGPIGSTSVARIDDSSFALTAAGTYLVTYTVTAAEAAQLVLTLDGTELAYTAAGRDATTSQITNSVIITSATPGAVLTLNNPTDATTSVTLTDNAGGALPVSAHLILLRLA